MMGVLLRERQEIWDSDTRKKSTWRQRKSPELCSRQKLEAARKDPPPAEGAWPSQQHDLDFWPPEMWKNTFLYISPRKLRQSSFFLWQTKVYRTWGKQQKCNVWIFAMNWTKTCQKSLDKHPCLSHRLNSESAWDGCSAKSHCFPSECKFLERKQFLPFVPRA